MYSYIHVYRKERKKVKLLSRVLLFATPWTIAYQAAPSMGFSRQEYWSGLPFASPGDFPDPGIEPRSPTLQSDALPSEPPGNNIVPASQLYSFLNIILIPPILAFVYIFTNITIAN